MATNTIDTSIIIVSFNTQKYLENCLNSIWANIKDTSYEVIVVDNASTDGSLDYLHQLESDKKIKLVSLPENLGFGGANNRGVAVASGKYLLFLNSDTLLEEDILTPTISYLDKHPEIGAYSCKLTFADGRSQPTGGFFPTLSRVFVWQLFLDDIPPFSSLIKSIHPKANLYDKDRVLDWVTGAFMVVPRQVFVDSGEFDEKMFMYVEELELCYRIKNKLNKEVIYHHTPQLIHYGGASGGSHLALTQEIKNMIYFFDKHKPAWQSYLVRLIFRAGCLLRWLIFGIIKRNEIATRAYAQAYRDFT